MTHAGIAVATTVAERVIDWPSVDGSCEEVSVVAVMPEQSPATDCTSVDVLATYPEPLVGM
jgi:hypothetical protein